MLYTLTSQERADREDAFYQCSEALEALKVPVSFLHKRTVLLFRSADYAVSALQLRVYQTDAPRVLRWDVDSGAIRTSARARADLQARDGRPCGGRLEWSMLSDEILTTAPVLAQYLAERAHSVNPLGVAGPEDLIGGHNRLINGRVQGYVWTRRGTLAIAKARERA